MNRSALFLAQHPTAAERTALLDEIVDMACGVAHAACDLADAFAEGNGLRGLSPDVAWHNIVEQAREIVAYATGEASPACQRADLGMAWVQSASAAELDALATSGRIPTSLARIIERLDDLDQYDVLNAVDEAASEHFASTCADQDEAA